MMGGMMARRALTRQGRFICFAVFLVLVLLVALLTLPILLKVAQAQEISVEFVWTVNPPETDGYRLYMGPTEEEGVLIEDVVGRLVDTVAITKDFEDRCQVFYLTAYTVDESGEMNEESGHSDTAEICVDRPTILRIISSPEIPQLRVSSVERADESPEPPESDERDDL